MTTVLEQIEALPRMPGAERLPPRTNEQYITLHYSGVSYNDVTPEMERARVIAEARYQIAKNWGSLGQAPVYGDGLMYDYVVLKSGEVIRTRRTAQQLWHCGNTLGNQCSWAVHVMLGAGQVLTSPQRAALFGLLDQLRTQSNIPRSNVVGHCEWPRVNGEPVRSTTYALLPGQSECPGRNLMAEVYAYRAINDTAVAHTVIDQQVVGNVPYAAIYTDRSHTAPRVRIDNKEANLWPGTLVELDDITNGWGHLSSQLGFVDMTFLKYEGTADPLPPPQIVTPVVSRHYSEASSIIVEYQADVHEDNIVAYLATLPNQPYTKEDITTIVARYKLYGEQSGVDWVAALAQNLLETDSLRSWWAQRPRRNPAGLRVTGEKVRTQPANDPQWAFNPGTGLWHRGMSFSSWDESAKAHMAYLLSYSATNDALTQTQRDFIASSTVAFVLTRTTNRGVAPTLAGLNGKWAVPGTLYATRIAATANMLAGK